MNFDQTYILDFANYENVLEKYLKYRSFILEKNKKIVYNIRTSEGV